MFARTHKYRIKTASTDELRGQRSQSGRMARAPPDDGEANLSTAGLPPSFQTVNVTWEANLLLLIHDRHFDVRHRERLAVAFQRDEVHPRLHVHGG